MHLSDVQVGAYVRPKVGNPKLYEVEGKDGSGKVLLRNVMVPADQCTGEFGTMWTTTLNVMRAFVLVVPEQDPLEALIAA